MIHFLSDRIEFPDPSTAEEDGLLAIGGDLSPERLMLAYRSGIFPWFSEGDPILWFSPHQRFVLFPEKLKVSKSMEQVLRSGRFRITRDTAFAEVIGSCAKAERKGQDGTWITADMIKAYCRLHELGHAHSIEAWDKDGLAGGLYGVQINDVFCGESMFSRTANASKAAFIHIVRTGGYRLIDCQVYTRHLQSLGAGFISRKAYEKYLREAAQ